MDKPQASDFTWTIENFSLLREKKKLYSEVFTVGGYEWRIFIFPKGNNVDYLSVYLDVADSTLPHGWTRHAAFDLAVVDQVHSNRTRTKYTQHLFNERENDWGFTSFLPLSELNESSNGYIVNDTCVIEANVRVIDDTKKEQSNDSGSPMLISQKSPPTGPLPVNIESDEGSLDSSIPDQDEGAAEGSSPIEVDDDIGDLFIDMDDLVDAVVAKPATSSSSDQAREKLKALLALDLGDVAERRGEIIGWASILASTSADKKKLLRELVTTTFFESFLSTKSEAADLEQKLSKRQILAEAFVEMPKSLESLKTEKKMADGNVSTHGRIIKECKDEIENLQKKIAHHKEQLGEARRLAKESKETFQAERDRAAKLKEELVATKDSATSWKEGHAAALAKAEELKREWAIFVENHSVI